MAEKMAVRAKQLLSFENAFGEKYTSKRKAATKYQHLSKRARASFTKRTKRKCRAPHRTNDLMMMTAHRERQMHCGLATQTEARNQSKS